MSSPNEPADPLAKGVIPTAKQGLSDLFKWKQRVVVINDAGESRCEWQTPEPLKNPISLFAQLSARDVSVQSCLVLLFTPGSGHIIVKVSN